MSPSMVSNQLSHGGLGLDLRYYDGISKQHVGAFTEQHWRGATSTCMDTIFAPWDIYDSIKYPEHYLGFSHG